MRQRGPGPAPAPAPADPARAASVRGIAERRSDVRGPLLPVLHEVVATHGHVTDDDVGVVAEVLNLSRADVHGVVTFYSDLRRTPPPAHRVALCRGEACQARGGESLHADAADRWSASVDVEVGEVFCLGLCAVGPAGAVDGTLHAALSPERLAALTDGWRR
ncbi:MAG TPA: NAD(P)H-dependent oxidoreductase subunit E [Ornithinibacter sp.]|nr:NAD(P)H-dependent oxidoreductase subunit E [Ornithinibacter sp.]